MQIRFNWVSSLMAICILWGFSIACIASDQAAPDFALGKSWVSQNFTWLYIGTQDAWCLFLIYLAFSRFANIKLFTVDKTLGGWDKVGKVHFADGGIYDQIVAGIKR